MKILVVSDGEFVAVDLTPQPQARLEDLQAGNARALRLVGTFYARAPEDTRKAFRGLAFRLSDRIVRGLWYAATDLEVLRELEGLNVELCRG